MSKPKPIRLNMTPDGQLACASGTPWLDHFRLPVGTGKGCSRCGVAPDPHPVPLMTPQEDLHD